MAHEKVPREYEQGTIQKIVERIKQAVTKSDQKQTKALQDQSQLLSDQISQVEQRLTEKIDSQTGAGAGRPTTVPTPRGLEVFEFGLWGFAYVDPFYRFKFPQTVRGYEFFGSQNVDDNDDFEVHADEYSQTGVHYGSGTLSYLDTEDTVGDNSWVFPRGLIGKTLQNLDTGEEGTITLYGVAKPKFRLFTNNSSLVWQYGDRWRIKKYPRNRLFNIGSLCIFYKRVGNIWIKARAFGKGHSYSNFTVATQSTGLTSSEEIEAPNIVYPVHNCGRTCTLEVADDYWPRCPVHGKITDWEEIVAGTRQVDHFSFFGFEGCNVELVYDEVEDETVDVLYRAKHQLLNEADDTVVDDEEDDTR